MADIHVLDGNGTTWRIAMHLAVPDINNPVGVKYRTALVNSGLGGTTAMAEGVGAGQISSAEKTLVEAGELYEHIASFRAESGGTSAEDLRNALQQFYAQEKDDTIAHMQRQLRYFGHTESEE